MEYKSEIFEVVHQNATDKYMIGAITPAQMREFDEMCLVQKPETAQKAAEPVKTEYISPIPAEI